MKALIFEAELDSNLDKIVQLGGKKNDKLFANAIKFIDNSIECYTVYPTRANYKLLSVQQLQQYNYVFWTGSALNAYDNDPRVLSQIAQAKLVFKATVPFFGSCFGLQVAVMASGGMVAKNKNGLEVGVAKDIVINQLGINHPMFKNRKSQFNSYCYHNSETVRLPTGAIVLASNNHSNIQALEIKHNGGTFWGVQYHPEFDLETMRAEYLLSHKSLESMGIIKANTGVENTINDLARQYKDDLSPHNILSEIRNFIHYYAN